MKFCPYCRAENPDEAKFCAECGRKFAENAFFAETAEPNDKSIVSEAPQTDNGSVISVSPQSDGSVFPETSGTPVFSENTEQGANGRAPQNQAPVVENRTLFNRSVLRNFYKNIRIFGICAAIFGALLILINVIAPFSDDGDRILLFCGIILVACGVALFVSQSTFIKKNKLITDSTYQIYRFGNEYVEVSSFDGNEQIDITRIRYEKITKVRKTKSHFLFYLGVVVWLVDRCGFTVGTEEEFIALLSARCKPKTIRFKTN